MCAFSYQDRNFTELLTKIFLVLTKKSHVKAYSSH